MRAGATAPAAHSTVYALRPERSIVIKVDRTVTVSLRRLDVDARDLFTGLISEQGFGPRFADDAVVRHVLSVKRSVHGRLRRPGGCADALLACFT